MEDRMDSHLWRQLQAVGQLTFTDDFFDPKWSHTPDIQFARRAVRTDIATVEPDVVANLELRCGLRMMIMVGLVQGLGMLQVVMEHSVELAELFNEAFGSGINGLGGCGNWQEVSRVVTLIGEEGGEFG